MYKLCPGTVRSAFRLYSQLLQKNPPKPYHCGTTRSESLLGWSNHMNWFLSSKNVIRSLEFITFRVRVYFWVVFVALVDFLALFARSFLSMEMYCLLFLFGPHLLENDCRTQDLRRLAPRSSPGAISDVSGSSTFSTTLTLAPTKYTPRYGTITIYTDTFTLKVFSSFMGMAALAARVQDTCMTLLRCYTSRVTKKFSTFYSGFGSSITHALRPVVQKYRSVPLAPFSRGTSGRSSGGASWFFTTCSSGHPRW